MLGRIPLLGAGSKAHHKQGVAVVEHVLRRDGSAQIGRPICHKLCCICRCDMLKHHPQVWNSIHEGSEDALDEHPFPVEEVDGWVGHLPMNKKGKTCLP